MEERINKGREAREEQACGLSQFTAFLKRCSSEKLLDFQEHNVRIDHWILLETFQKANGFH